MKLIMNTKLLFILSFFLMHLGVQAECIGVITAGGGKGFWGEVKKGGMQAGKHLGVTVFVMGTKDEGDIAEQKKLIEHILIKGCTGLVLAPNTQDRKQLIGELKQQGILTVFIDRDIGGARLSVVKTDNIAAGRLAGKEMVKALAGKGNVALLRYHRSLSTTNEREKGFIDEVLKGGLNIIYDGYVGTTIAEARANSLQVFNRIKDLDGIFTANESSTMGVIATVKMLNLSADIVHIGFDSSKFMVTALQHDQVYGFVVQNPYQMGYQGVLSVYRALRNENIETRIDTGTTFVSKENIATPLVKKLLNLP